MKCTIVSILMISMFLTGCMLPDEQRSENQLAYPDQLQAVEQAAKQFQQDTGVLPIRNFDETTPLYQRYVVDFNQLVPRYLQQPPGTAFENGGVFQYVLVNVEEEPEAKVIDLRSQREIQQFQQRINEYMRKHTYAPVLEMVDVGLFKLDHEALNYSEAPHVRSPYYDTYLPLLYTNDGEIVIDYRIDLNMALNEFEHDFKENEDIRSILVDNFPIVPVRSVPYTLDENGEPAYNIRQE
ncbi:hypothetical protein M3689_03700 [Alkalihalophilus marmarensis]|uniref:ABC transporter periplasmic binding protein yphF n=1 Tax=Alkalihalophilus marmarensis DSM 21297 TaxID=1188261 RepID=U6STC8_9BACI|nr:hypothetical protein [Alkalihalophilus marmarensis]ERN54170.1 hypothetical protein A33I_07025 [Alkalihalophilus marmarensis DSM 21297]MCM3488409.1 hypothetical protein [Alkalihalophilus marmarensis]